MSLDRNPLRRAFGLPSVVVGVGLEFIVRNGGCAPDKKNHNDQDSP